MNISEQIDELIERQRGLNKLSKQPMNTFYYVRGCGLVHSKSLICGDSVIVCDVDKARALYLDEYVYRAGIGLLPDQLQPLIFHMAVDDSLSNAFLFLQNTLSKLLSGDIEPAIEVTGHMDAVTIKAAKLALRKFGARYVVSFLVNAYIEQCRQLYKGDKIAIEKKSFLARRFVH